MADWKTTVEQESTTPGLRRAPKLSEVKAKRAAMVDKWGVLPYQIRPVLKAIREAGKEATLHSTVRVARAFRVNFPVLGRDVSELTARVALGMARWWDAVVAGRNEGKAECKKARDVTDEARDGALANAAMLAYDMGHPDVRHAINQLIPPGPRRPSDTPPGGPYDGHPMSKI